MAWILVQNPVSGNVGQSRKSDAVTIHGSEIDRHWDPESGTIPRNPS